MSVDLHKNQAEIIDAWKDVVDPKTDTDWVLFGYEGQSNVLKLVSSGNGGLTELTDDLNSGKIQYAFVNITNNTTNLTKYLLINWQGEGVPTLRKGTCANHIRDIQKVLTGAHLTLNARTEDDIDPERILEKLNSIRFAVKEKCNTNDVKDEPQKIAIGTNYSRVIPSREINSKDRSNFWKKEEEMERIRVEAERGKQMSIKLELEKEQKLREMQEHTKRENERILIESPPEGAQADEMRKQRNQEVRQLIGSSVDKAKAIFSQNIAEQSLSKTTKTAPVKPARNSITRSANNQRQPISESEISHPQNEQHEQIEQTEQLLPQKQASLHCNEDLVTGEEMHNLEYDDNDPYSTIKRSPYTKASTEDRNELIIGNKQDLNNHSTIAQKAQIEDVGNSPPNVHDQGLRARALYDYQADDESEITFDPGDIITNIDQIDEGWWQGLGPDGTYGLFPANYVELLNN